jgi:hypothetical protein
MTYPHVTQFETVELRASLAARRAHPRRAKAGRGTKRVARRGAPLRNEGGSVCTSC